MKYLSVLAVALTAVLLCWAPARASELPQFRMLPALTVGDTVIDLAVTPDGRYVIALGGPTKTLRFIDTWDFTVLDGSTEAVDVSGSSTPTVLAVSPYGDYAYVGLANGHVLAVALAQFKALLPYKDLLLAPTLIDIDVDAASALGIDTLAAIPDVNGTAGWVYLLAGTGGGLRWAELQAGNAVQATGPIGSSRTSLAMARGKKYGYDLYSIAGPANYLRVVSCNQFLSPPCSNTTTVYPIPLGNDALAGLAADPDDDRLTLTMDLDTGDLWLIDTKPVASMAVADGFTVNLATKDVALITGGVDAAFIASGATVKATVLLGDTSEFTGETKTFVQTGAGFTELAASADGYLYAAGAGGAIYIVTQNPWLEDLTVGSGSTISGDTVSVSFKASSQRTGAFKFYLYNDESFGEWSNLIASGQFTLSGSSVTGQFTAGTGKLTEGKTNVFTLLVTDPAGHAGRTAAAAYVDTAPTPPNFSLSFGDRRLIVDISGAPDQDLASYKIYYGVNGGSTVGYAALNGANSPLTVSSPKANQDYSVTIRSLQNGVRVWVQVVAIDQGGLVGVGARKSAVPQPVVTLADLTDEEGGVNCLGSVSRQGGDPGSAAGLLVPALLLGLYRAWRRRAR